MDFSENDLIFRHALIMRGVLFWRNIAKEKE